MHLSWALGQDHHGPLEVNRVNISEEKKHVSSLEVHWRNSLSTSFFSSSILGTLPLTSKLLSKCDPYHHNSTVTFQKHNSWFRLFPCVWSGNCAP